MSSSRLRAAARLAPASLGALFALGCTTQTTPTGHSSGTLLLNAEVQSYVYSFDLASGATSKLVAGADPFRTPDGTILCRNSNTQDLGEYSADGTQFRVIVPNNIGAPYDVTYDDHFQNPQLSPDGKFIAYEGQFGYTFDIYVVDRASGALLAGVADSAVGVGYVRPTWTPDGRLVVAGGPNNPGLYLSDATWTQFTRFDPNLSAPDQPAVSPDGKTVAFVMNSHIFTVGIDGTGVAQRTQSSGTESWPLWSTDGTEIITYTDTSIAIVPLGGGDATDLKDLNDNFLTFTASLGSGQMTWR
jgi:hypothetical protein